MTNSIHFAPLQGYTDSVYRNAHARVVGGVDCYYTPFVRVEKGTFRNKELRDISPDNNQTILLPQGIAGTPDELRALATLFIEQGYKRMDLNLGCSFPLQARKHKGAGLLACLTEAEALLGTLSEFPELRFSVKMRLGWSCVEEGLALLPLLNSMPLEQVAIHARLGIQQYKGTVDLEGFERLYSACTHPVLYNGDIKTVADYALIRARFPNLKGVLIGRGLLANPFLANECQGVSYSVDEKRNLLQLLHQELFDYYTGYLQGEHQIVAKLQSIWEYLLPDADKKLHKKISKSTRVESYKEAVNLLLKEYADV